MADILLVEDDRVLNDGLKIALEKEGHIVMQSYDGNIVHTKYDLAILDVNLPTTSGFELSKQFECPILFLTALSKESDILKGFSLGCEDYITKPFSLSVLIEKVKVILRRSDQDQSYRYRSLSYDRQTMVLTIENEVIKLTKKEHDLIAYFIDHKGQVLSKNQLLDAIWDQHGDFVNEGTVNVTINRLRKKLNTEHQWIETIFGIGYKWSE